MPVIYITPGNDTPAVRYGRAGIRMHRLFSEAVCQVRSLLDPIEESVGRSGVDCRSRHAPQRAHHSPLAWSKVCAAIPLAAPGEPQYAASPDSTSGKKRRSRRWSEKPWIHDHPKQERSHRRRAARPHRGNRSASVTRDRTPHFLLESLGQLAGPQPKAASNQYQRTDDRVDDENAQEISARMVMRPVSCGGRLWNLPAGAFPTAARAVDLDQRRAGNITRRR